MTTAPAGSLADYGIGEDFDREPDRNQRERGHTMSQELTERVYAVVLLYLALTDREKDEFEKAIQG